MNMLSTVFEICAAIGLLSFTIFGVLILAIGIFMVIKSIKEEDDK